MDPKFAGKAVAAPYSGRTDIDQMPDTPNRGAHHRRAQSETFFRFPDDILLDDVVADFNLASLDIPSLSSDTEANAPMALDSSKSDSSNGGDKSKPTRSTGPTPHFRSLSVGADFFEGLEFTSGDGAAVAAESERFGGKPPAASHYRHRHSNSMDGSMSSFEADSSVMIDGVKKTMAPDRLAELALLDPKRAKSNSCESTICGTFKGAKNTIYKRAGEESTDPSDGSYHPLCTGHNAPVRDTTGLTTENKELKLRLQAMEQQAHLRDALNEALREEVQRLKIATGQIPAANGNPFNRALPPQFSSHPQMFQQFGTNQTQQPRQQHQTPNAQPQQSFSDFNQRVP
ncbi:unnamed protein product [Camellia sinensis]